MKPIYLDYAAATPLDADVKKTIEPYLGAQFYNPSALYEPARRVKLALETARHEVAKKLGAKQSEIIFTAGATESINMALFGIAKKNPGKKVIVSAIEHEAVLQTATAAFGKKNVLVCPVKPSGIVDLEKLASLLSKKVILISIMQANNEVGSIQPLEKISQLIKKSGYKIYLHSDGAQAPNYLDVQVHRLGVDLLSLNGSKIYGPKQSGCLYVKTGVELEALIYGGGQERGLRSGTENVAGCIGFAVALQLADKRKDRESKRLSGLQKKCVEKLQQLNIGIQLNGDMRSRLPNNINITVPGVSGESLVHYLDAAGILVATGSACSANSDKPSHVLAALGLEPGQINSSLRISMGRQTTQKQVDIFIRELSTTIGKLKALAG